MKSTGLFGKNSGRVGGVVYSNYRGEQIVRSYQPKVYNPNTKKQVSQRAKFKLVAQVGASLGKEIKMSFVPNVAKESSRNAFAKAMLKKTLYDGNTATLPIEEIVLTNSHVSGFSTIEAQGGSINGAITEQFGAATKVRIVQIAYNEGGQIVVMAVDEPTITEQSTTEGTVRVFQSKYRNYPGYTNTRALVYAYEPDKSTGTSYEDYAIISEEATLSDILKTFSGRLQFSETFNISLPQNV